MHHSFFVFIKTLLRPGLGMASGFNLGVTELRALLRSKDNVKRLLAATIFAIAATFLALNVPSTDVD